MHSLSVEFTPRPSAEVFKQASLILFCNWYSCIVLSVRIVEMSALVWSLGEVGGQTRTIPNAGEVWGANISEGNGNCLNPSARPGSVGWVLWMVAVMSSSYLLVDIGADDLSADPLRSEQRNVSMARSLLALIFNTNNHIRKSTAL